MATAKGKGASLSPFDSPTIGLILKTPVRPKRNKARPIRVKDQIAKTVNPKIPEVLVKIKRGGKSASHLMAHLEYITRNGKLDGETERGEIIQGKPHLKEVFKEWTNDAESIKPGARNAINSIFSMPPGTDPEGVKKAVRAFAKQELANYQYIFVLHTDDPHPHCHLSIKTLGFDGRKLDPRKDDIQLWREVFAEKLNDLGIPAKATYRPARGIVEKRPSMAQYKAAHDRKDERSHYTYEARVRDAAAATAGEPLKWVSGKPMKKDPWGEQQRIRAAWSDLTTQLRATGDAEDRELAEQIMKFVSDMPPVQTQHQRLTAQLLALQSQTRVQQPGKEPAVRPRDDDKGRSR